MYDIESQHQIDKPCKTNAVFAAFMYLNPIFQISAFDFVVQFIKHSVLNIGGDDFS